MSNSNMIDSFENTYLAWIKSIKSKGIGTIGYDGNFVVSKHSEPIRTIDELSEVPISNGVNLSYDPATGLIVLFAVKSPETKHLFPKKVDFLTCIDENVKCIIVPLGSKQLFKTHYVYAIAGNRLDFERTSWHKKHLYMVMDRQDASRAMIAKLLNTKDAARKFCFSSLIASFNTNKEYMTSHQLDDYCSIVHKYSISLKGIAFSPKCEIYDTNKPLPWKYTLNNDNFRNFSNYDEAFAFALAVICKEEGIKFEDFNENMILAVNPYFTTPDIGAKPAGFEILLQLPISKDISIEQKREYW